MNIRDLTNKNDQTYGCLSNNNDYLTNNNGILWMQIVFSRLVDVVILRRSSRDKQLNTFLDIGNSCQLEFLATFLFVDERVDKRQKGCHCKKTNVDFAKSNYKWASGAH